MFDHIGYEVRDLKKSAHFYEKALGALGHKQLVDLAEYKVKGYGTDHAQFWIGEGTPQTGEDPIHICFAAKNRKEVDAFYKAAMAAGGRDNGKPGLRPEYHEHYYGAFVLDPDGYNIEACYHLPE